MKTFESFRPSHEWVNVKGKNEKQNNHASHEVYATAYFLTSRILKLHMLQILHCLYISMNSNDPYLTVEQMFNKFDVIGRALADEFVHHLEQSAFPNQTHSGH